MEVIKLYTLAPGQTSLVLVVDLNGGCNINNIKSTQTSLTGVEGAQSVPLRLEGDYEHSIDVAYTTHKTHSLMVEENTSSKSVLSKVL